jgi:hypothetical protein
MLGGFLLSVLKIKLLKSPSTDMEVNNSLAVAQSAAANPDHHPNFIEGNANAITLTDLRNRCIVPTWANNQLTISHPAFIETVLAAAQATFSGNEVNAPEIRVSHPVLGRVPGAIHKKASDLLDSDKTLYYQRICFCIAVSINDIINGNETNVVVGGVRALNNENLSSRPRSEVFKLFAGVSVKVCSNQCIFGADYLDKFEAMSESEIFDGACELFRNFDPVSNKRKLELLGNTTMTTEDFTHVIGRMRLYEALPMAKRNQLGLPAITLGDQALNSATRGFVANKDFGCREDGTITMGRSSICSRKQIRPVISTVSLPVKSMQCNGYRNRYLQRSQWRRHSLSVVYPLNQSEGA